MGEQIDMQGFVSRLHLLGRLVVHRGLRVAAGREITVGGSDLPVIKDSHDRPYIPGTSFKGAWRAYTERVLRAIEQNQGVQGLACISVPRSAIRSADSAGCLTAAEVADIKRDSAYSESPAVLDATIRTRSCLACRLFGAPWLASKALIRDLQVDPATYYRPEVRDGVGIDRDTVHQREKHKYDYEVVPLGAVFEVDIIIENAGPEELGAAWLGLAAFEQGQVQLGGARSRGVGWCRLAVDWEKSVWLEGRTGLLQALFPGEAAWAVPSEIDWEQRTNAWIDALEEYVAQRVQGGGQ